ncbi:STAS domain-containing protein [Paractinoplanes hotanensis]|uniref:STAS domain-containing protein n=1 Tax=Paractinoplanes hotanensis TaxID=2906497 RepID=A0ABT0YG64_9ACTN|nr:STAS domain-containing protein [Actinoplanes hotanensis]MCM4085051.1 STAS domain-containing protein [Actinoplanes hotanensis]
MISTVQVRVDQDLDLASVGEIGAVLDTAMGLHPARLVVDLAGCPFIDASGVSLLLAAHRRARQCDGRLVLRSASPLVRRVLHLARVYDVLTVETPARTEDDARPEKQAQER